MSTREYTFRDLFGSTFQVGTESIQLRTIEIPIIQRDYAQGRLTEDVRRIRERFLDALFAAVVGQKAMALDFVYGEVSPDGVLTPLDGQQRLTTLFLLHWYIAKKEGISPEEYGFLQHFSYATRFSSRDFCRELVDYTPDFAAKELSLAIKDQAWYPYEWKNDSTIQGMLVMLDAIHTKFHNHTGLWESLVEKGNLSFYFLPLTEMGLTDELYIKMNSRGRPLTPFEHFKAEFGEMVKEVAPDLSEEINRKLDIEWAEMLFPWRGKDNIIDDEFMRYFRFVSDIVAYEADLDLEKDEFEIARLLYSKANDDGRRNIQYLMGSLDCWIHLPVAGFFTTFFSGNEHEQGKVQLYQDGLNLFKECLDGYGEYSGRNRKFPLNKTLLLFSVVTYLQNKERITEAQFRDRIRIVRNLIWNSTDEIRDDRMKNLISEAKQIVLHGIIAESGSGDLGFNARQKEEEQRKLRWVAKHKGKEWDLHHLEDHQLLRGSVSIIDLDKIDHFGRFRLLFDNCSKDLINRTLLALGDYSQTIGWRAQLGARHNESPWIDLFHASKQRVGFERTFAAINQLLSTLNESEINNGTLEERVQAFLTDPNTAKDWRYYLVKYPAMRKGNFGMYYWKDVSNKDYEMIMMNTEKSLGGRNWNVFLYTLYTSPVFSGELQLGDYAYQGDRLRIPQAQCEIECLNDRYVIHFLGGRRDECAIHQRDGIDIEDRIEKGKKLIRELLATSE